MKPVYIFRHIACEGPGYLGEFLNRHHIPYRIIAIDKGDAVPADFTAMSGLVFMGGPMSVNDPLPWIAAELDLIRQPYGLPSTADFTFALLVLTLPQLPMTLGNAVMANADLSLQYFPQDGHRVTYRSLCISMALGNLMSFFVGGMPMCHGAGGLASRYRFGARTAGSNLIIGTVFIVLALFLGQHIMGIIYLLPMSALGILLIFAGAQLCLTLLDMKTRKELFIPILVVGITIASNLAAGFLAGIVVAHALKSEKLTV